MNSFDNQIIPAHILDEFLKMGGTPPSEVKNASGWKKIIEQLKQRYQLYCGEVCKIDKNKDKDKNKEKDKNTFHKHLVKWNMFHNSLGGQNCIHY